MKNLRALVIVAAVAALALPAEAAPPSRVARLTREVTVLRAKVTKLTAANRKLRHANKILSEDNQNLNAYSDRLEHYTHALEAHVLQTDPCPITRPNGSEPPGPTFGAPFLGNGSLWVGLGPTNIVVSIPDPDGTMWDKFGWWRAVTGQLRITGQRIDGPAPPLKADILPYYGDSGFQPTGIGFPTAGCWRVTGSVGAASLTFVTLVIAA